MPRAVYAGLAGLLVLGIGSLYLAKTSWDSVDLYRPRHAVHADLAGGEPLAQRVVLIVLDGIRLDVSRHMEFLASLASKGSSGISRAGLPSLSNPGRATLVTGAWPEISGVTSNTPISPPPVDSVFSLAAKAGIPRAAAGSRFWRQAFGAYLRGDLLITDKSPHIGATVAELKAWQRETCVEMERFVGQDREGFIAIDITAADGAGHDFGGASIAYREVASEVDRCLETLVSSLADSRTTFIVTSDHGHIDRRAGGGHGGNEPEVTAVPLVLAGRAIRVSSGWKAQSVDVAPTICALLGLPLPASSQGNILWQTLDLPPPAETLLRRRAERQRLLAASELAVRAEGLTAERQERSRVSAAWSLLLAAIAGAALRRQRDIWRRLLVAVAIYFGVYYLCFTLAGLGYSLSVLGRQEYLPAFLGKNLAAAVAATLAASVFLRKGASPTAALRLLDCAVVITAALGLAVSWAHYRTGLFMGSFMPDLTLTFKACLDLLQIFAIAVTTPIVVWLDTRSKAATWQP